jgi:glutamate 5-kinase
MDLNDRNELIQKAKRVVIKIGSSVLAYRAPGDGEAASLVRGLCPQMVGHCARKLRKVVDAGREVVLVSSGAIMAGRKLLCLSRPNLSIPEKQACAAIGQSRLMHLYENKFARQGIQVAQILLSNDDLEHRKRYLNAKNTIDALLARKVVPIINENDTVTVDEIKIGDNDTLSATVACLVNADLLIILSDVAGLYTSDPSKKVAKDGLPPELIPHVAHVTTEMEQSAGRSRNGLTVGGMYTKLVAAKKTMSFGIPTLVVNGLDKNVLDKIFSGKKSVGTLFWSEQSKIRDRKHWIAHTLKPAGAIVIDDGAKRAVVERGKSLLPAGVVAVEGAFDFGNAVRILGADRREFARGLVNYAARDLDRVKGMKTAEIRQLVGDNFYEEVIHRDDLVLL